MAAVPDRIIRIRYSISGAVSPVLTGVPPFPPEPPEDVPPGVFGAPGVSVLSEYVFVIVTFAVFCSALSVTLGWSMDISKPVPELLSTCPSLSVSAI